MVRSMGHLNIGAPIGTGAIEYQNKKYGMGNRVHNPVKSGKEGIMYRCTCCGNTRGKK